MTVSNRWIAAVVAALILLAQLIGAGAAQAAPQQTRNIAFAFNNVSFNSILGGYTNGTATLDGQISADGAALSRLSGQLDFPLRGDYKLTADPTGAIQTTTSSTPVYWQLYQCDPFFNCTVDSGTATYAVVTKQAPAPW